MDRRLPLHFGRATAYRVVDSAIVEQLEQQRLTHSVPSRVSDHACIRWVRFQRWISEKFLRERYLHRATMHHCIYASSAAAMATNIKYRSLWSSSRKSAAHSPSSSLPAASTEAATSSSISMSSSSELQPTDVVTPSPENAARKGSSMDELRRCYSEQELHFRHVLFMKELIQYSRAELAVITMVQWVNYLFFLAIFTLSRRSANRLMGYALEESAVVLTHMINDIDTAKIEEVPLPQQVHRYYDFVDPKRESKTGLKDEAGEKVVADTEQRYGQVACLRTLALLMRSEHIACSEWHHQIADDLDENKRSSGNSTSFT